MNHNQNEKALFENKVYSWLHAFDPSVVYKLPDLNREDWIECVKKYIYENNNKIFEKGMQVEFNSNYSKIRKVCF